MCFHQATIAHQLIDCFYILKISAFNESTRGVNYFEFENNRKKKIVIGIRVL